MSTYSRRSNRNTESEGDPAVNTTEGETSNPEWMNTMRNIIEDVLNQRRTQEEQPIIPPNSQHEKEKENKNSDQSMIKKLAKF